MSFMDFVELIVFYLSTVLPALAPPAFFLFLCAMLMEPRCTRRTEAGVGLAFLLLQCVLQGGAYLAGADGTYLLTLLPLTLYLPAVVLVHILSANRFLPTCYVWLAGTMAVFFLRFWEKLLPYGPGPLITLPMKILRLVLYLAAIAALAWAAVVFLRKPFQTYVRTIPVQEAGLLFPLLMNIALLSYFTSSTTDLIPLFLALLTSLTTVILLSRYLITSVSLRAAEEKKAAIRLQMKAQQLSYEAACQKLELGRTYRHDMRQHLVVLNELLNQEKTSSAKEYIHNLDLRLTETQPEVYCGNTAVNAILAAYFTRAREVGCRVKAVVNLPDELPFEEQDLCVLLGNTLENAIYACQRMSPKQTKEIVFTAGYSPRDVLTVKIENTCAEEPVFDADGFPLSSQPGPDHGIGLRSVGAIAEKYNGLMSCGCTDRRFTIQLVLFKRMEPDVQPAASQARWRPLTSLAAIGLCLFFLNCSPALAGYLEAIPVIGSIVRVVDLRQYEIYWGASRLDVEQPVLDGPGGEDLNEPLEAYAAQLEETFRYYVSRRYKGYTSLDTSYTVLRDDGVLLIIRMDGTINVGGTVDMRRHFVMDQASGELLALPDLFFPDVNYQFPISREIKAQMEEQNNAGLGYYFLPGGSYPEEECFRSIDEEQDFYINEAGQLVIAFDEYTVAPGSMGAPEFVIPTDLLDGLLSRSDLLQ